MSFPMGSILVSVQNPAFLPPLILYLAAPPAPQWKVAQPNGIYAPPGDVLYFFAGPNDPTKPAEPGTGGSPNLNAGNVLMIPPASASFVGNPLALLFDQQAYRIADGVKSGTVYAPPSNIGQFGRFATITIPAGELLLFASWGMNTPSSQCFICPASYAQRMAWQITTWGG